MDNSGNTSGSTRDTIYSFLRKNIINLNLFPGMLISEKDISQKLHVSRTPVREAFIRLSQEALISIIPQKGTFVSKIDLARVQEERFLRESLEYSVLDLFIKYQTDESLNRLRLNIKKQREAIKEGDIAKFISFDDQFHCIMFEETEKSHCYSVMQNFSSHYHRIRYLSLFLTDVTKLNIEQHLELVEAIEKCDGLIARDIMKRHIRKLITEKDSIRDKYPEYFQQDEEFQMESIIFEKDGNMAKLFSDKTPLE